ncbi:hypothetical protein T4D_11271 [Trichinella pseudospiralis]|uniref:Uncharacterized protein n=1 Tax=Trichinella pseudospiralis TaxID=6337 RepID=A0A0V1F7Z4_TRIPS|nr:hypothetical protein T4D_11271 [Trichinella pseudospiralis]
MITHDILSYTNSVFLQVFGVCKRKKNDGEEGAPPTVKVEPLMPCVPSSPYHLVQIETNQLTQMVIPDYKSAIATPVFPSPTTSAEAAVSFSSEGLPITTETITYAIPTDVVLQVEAFLKTNRP